MAGPLDDFELPLTCPHCGTETKQSIGRLKALDDFTCPGCGAVYEPDELKTAIRKIEKSIAGLGDLLGEV